MHFPKISIVTPSFNQGQYIEQTILSVINQQYPNLEYIIIDGGSTDHTVEIIKKYEKYLSYWVSEEDAGQTDAINKGFAKCTGDVFNWINSDDYYEPGVFQKIAEIFNSDENIEVVCGKEWGFNNENPTDRILHPGSIIEEDVYKTICTGIIDQPCTFFKLKKIADYFPLNTSLRYVMDRQLWWSYLLKNGQEHIKSTELILTNFRLHLSSKSVQDGHKFESEFDQLKLTLFKQLNAPHILLSQLIVKQQDVFIEWEISIGPRERILAAFASFYAGLQYVKGDLQQTGVLMKLVRDWKLKQLNSTERKWWLVGNVIPHFITKLVKKLRGK